MGTAGRPRPEARGSAPEKASRMGNAWMGAMPGVRNITWYAINFSWRLTFRTKATSISFPIGPLLEQGVGEEEAVAAALRKAKAHRKALLKPLAALKREQSKRSSVKGVGFDKRAQKWRVLVGCRHEEASFGWLVRHATHFAWRLQVNIKAKAKNISFSTCPFLEQGVSEERGVAAALRKFKAHRKERARAS